MMLDGAETVRFSKQRVTIYISASTLRSLNIKDSDRFSITIEKHGDSGFAFFTEINGVPLGALPGTVVMLPYRMSDEAAVPILTGVQEPGVTGGYDKSLAVVSFVVERTGRYTVSERPTEATETPAAAEAAGTTVPDDIILLGSATELPTATEPQKVTGTPTATGMPKVTGTPTATVMPKVTGTPTATATVPQIATQTQSPTDAPSTLQAPEIPATADGTEAPDENGFNGMPFALPVAVLSGAGIGGWLLRKWRLRR